MSIFKRSHVARRALLAGGVLAMAGATISGFAATAASGLCGMTSALLSGALSDRVGRKPVMMGGSLLLAAAAVPLFAALTQAANLIGLVLVAGGMAALLVVSARRSFPAPVAAVYQIEAEGRLREMLLNPPPPEAGLPSALRVSRTP